MCIAALSAKGYDRHTPAYNELANKAESQLITLYEKHKDDQLALGNAIARLCASYGISYTSKHYNAQRGTPLAPAEVTPAKGKETFVSLDQTHWSVPVVLSPAKTTDGATDLSLIHI